jgi:hypothetical protein
MIVTPSTVISRGGGGGFAVGITESSSGGWAGVGEALDSDCDAAVESAAAAAAGPVDAAEMHSRRRQQRNMLSLERRELLFEGGWKLKLKRISGQGAKISNAPENIERSKETKKSKYQSAVFGRKKKT